MKNNRNTTLIIGLVLAIIALLTSWIPFISIGAMVFGILALIFVLVASLKDWKSTKILAITSFVIIVASLGIAVHTTIVGNAQVTNSLSGIVELNSSSISWTDNSNNFKWNKGNFANLKTGNIKNGKDGDTYKKVVDKYGSPEDINESHSSSKLAGRGIREATWSDGDRNVKLTFIQQENGLFLLSDKSSENLK